MDADEIDPVDQQESWGSIVLQSHSSFHSKAPKVRGLVESTMSRYAEQAVSNEVDRSVVKQNKLMSNNSVKISILDNSMTS